MVPGTPATLVRHGDKTFKMERTQSTSDKFKEEIKDHVGNLEKALEFYQRSYNSAK